MAFLPFLSYPLSFVLLLLKTNISGTCLDFPCHGLPPFWL